jgi:long-chain acyl-CoA synthetase
MELSDQDNLSDLFLRRVEETPGVPAYRQFEGDAWRVWTWSDAGREVGRWQEALRREGLKPGDRIALCLHNRVEWVLFDQAAIGLGLVTVPLYFGDRADNMAFCLNDADARLLLLEDTALWPELRGQLRTVERVVVLDGKAIDDPAVTRLRTWLPADETPPVRSGAKPDDLVTLVYTSGTTGRPKGVMLSHRNILSNVIVGVRALPADTSDRFLSFLPLSHMFERTCGYYSAIAAGAETVYARSISQLSEDIRLQQPTILVTVPRIFERIWARMQQAMPEGSLKRRLFDAAVAAGWRRFNHEATATDNFLWPLYSLLVARKLYRRLGGRLRMVIVGGAALSPHLSRIFVGLGLPIIHGYGLTETAPVLAANRVNDNDPASVGRPLEGIELRCADNGELLARGPNIMLGYWNNMAATAAAIDHEGWFHTGDLAQIRNGRVYITGRVKDIIVLSNGEKVPPGDAEQAILRDEVFEQVMVIGEGRARLGLLCVSKLDNAEELCERANRQLREFPGYAKIAYVTCTTEPWTEKNGLVTPTLKLKRQEIIKRYASDIETMYGKPEMGGGNKPRRGGSDTGSALP